ncbi:MAG: hypothetical protein KGH93_00460 [Patescibacteria group bacterium]|nr:hypothetical protein [Patescibacteria group bacterium]MDE1945662.1 hypothetical protein [Patescibacteria group bacterium]
MFRFIKMWLLLRILAYQEECIFSEQKDSAQEYQNGSVLYANQKGFITDATTYNLFRAILPERFRVSLKPKKQGEKTRVNESRIRELDSLIELAKTKGFIDSPKEGMQPKSIVTKKPQKINRPAIRLSPLGDQFITYWGGLEIFIKTFPGVWGIVGISLVPWLIINYHSISNLIKNIF